MAPCGAGDPFDCGRRARKSRWKSRAGAESTRLVVLVPKITVLRAWDTQGLFARSRGSVACSALTLTNAALAKPTATVALANPAIVIAASVVSQSTAAVALAATAVALSPPPGHHHRHRHRPRRHGLRHPLPGRRRVAAFAFAFAFAATAQPAQSASAALAALATVEGRGASLIRSRLKASSRRFDRCAERLVVYLRFWLKAPHKRQFLSRDCRHAPRGGPRSAFFSLYQLFPVHILGARLRTGTRGLRPRLLKRARRQHGARSVLRCQSAPRAPPHHMLFKGADGVPYEVRGEVGSVFNILSSPRLSINSLFVQVPPRFPVCVPAE